MSKYTEDRPSERLPEPYRTLIRTWMNDSLQLGQQLNAEVGRKHDIPLIEMSLHSMYEALVPVFAYNPQADEERAFVELIARQLAILLALLKPALAGVPEIAELIKE